MFLLRFDFASSLCLALVSTMVLVVSFSWCFVKVVAKETERKERLQHEQTKLAATVKEVKEAKKTHEAVSGECTIVNML